MKEVNQQDFLKGAAKALGLTQKEFAAKIEVPWPTFQKWLLPDTSKGKTIMNPMTRKVVGLVISEHKKSGRKVK